MLSDNFDSLLLLLLLCHYMVKCFRPQYEKISSSVKHLLTFAKLNRSDMKNSVTMEKYTHKMSTVLWIIG